MKKLTFYYTSLACSLKTTKTDPTYLLDTQYKVTGYSGTVTYKKYTTVTLIHKNVIAFFTRQQAKIPTNTISDMFTDSNIKQPIHSSDR